MASVGEKLTLDLGEYLCTAAHGHRTFEVDLLDVGNELGLDCFDVAAATGTLREMGFEFELAYGDPIVQVTVPGHLLEIA